MDDKDNILLQASGDTPQKSRNAITSFILANTAIGSLFAAQLIPPIIFLYLAFLGAIIYGHLGKNDIRKDPDHTTGFAMAQYGLMVGYFCLLLTTIVIIALTGGYQVLNS